MFDWSFNFLQHCSGEIYEVPLVLAFCDLIVQTVFRIAFQGRMRVRFKTRQMWDKE